MPASNLQPSNPEHRRMQCVQRRRGVWRNAMPLALALLLPRMAAAADDILPGTPYVTARAGGVVLHYPPSQRHLAQRIAAIAAWSGPLLAAKLGYAPRREVHVVIVVDNDFANGFASVTPRNTIRLFTAPPRQPSLLSEYDDWLELLFVHELVHIYHLDWHEWPATLLRYVFGRNFIQEVIFEGATRSVYLGFPNGLLPDTLIEGYAVAYESSLVGRGRANSTLGLSLLRNAARDGALPPLDAAGSERRAWPRGNSPRLYGGRFHLYAAEVAGVDWAEVYRFNASGMFGGIWGLALDWTAGQLPVALWNDWRSAEAELQRDFDARVPPDGDAPRFAGPFQDIAALRWAPDGRLIAAVRDDMRPAEVRAFAADGGSETWAEHFGGKALAFAATDQVWLDQFDVVRDTVSVSELFVGPPGRWTRQTTDAHIHEPDVAAGRFVWVRRRGDTQCLEWGDAATRRVDRRICAPPEQPLHHPRLRPDGDAVVFVRWQPQGRDDVYVWYPVAARIERLTHATSDDRMPQWASDGRTLYAVRALDGVPDLYAYRISAATWHRVTHTRTGMWHAAVRDDGRLAYVTAEGDGMWLRVAESLPALGAPVSDVVASGPDSRWRLPGAAVTPVTMPLGDERPYRAWRTLAPMSWTPVLGIGDGKSNQYGARVGGSDVKRDWLWGVQVLIRGDGEPNVGAAVQYDRGDWRYGAAMDWNTLSAPGDTVTTRRLRPELRLIKPLRRRDWSASWLLEAAVERLVDGDDDPSRVQIGGAFSFDNRERPAYALVPLDGVFFRVLAAGDAPAGDFVGARRIQVSRLNCSRASDRPDGRAEAVAATGFAPRRWLQLQAQAAAGGHADPRGPLCYRLLPPFDATFGARTFVGRGVPQRLPGDDTGSDGVRGVHRFGLWEAEAVVPLAFIERGLRSFPVFFDNTAVRGFAAGAHWRQRGPWKRDVYLGTELGLDVITYWSTFTSLRLGYRRSAFTGNYDVYLDTGFSFADGGRLLRGDARHRPAAPECFECDR